MSSPSVPSGEGVTGRRRFLGEAAGAVGLSAASYNRVKGAGERVGLGSIGTGGLRYRSGW